MNQEERREFLIRELLKELPEQQQIPIPPETEDQKVLLRGLMNVRSPREISEKFLEVQDDYLARELQDRGVTGLRDLKPLQDGLYLWQGDITTLECDAIVNAANSGMTGCYIWNHRCIDNCIHSFAGIQLRLECAKRMQEQGHEEPVGSAKITMAYNLPCQYVIHTVGPIVTGPLTEENCRDLVSCYRSCLELAEQHWVQSLAFCCISTGEFHFPNRKAAELAVQTVKEYKQQTGSSMEVVFNVFKDEDRDIYAELLGAD